MIVYPWKAGTATGVTDDNDLARKRAEDAMIANGARTAVVDTAYTGSLLSLDGTYMRWGGLRWIACRAGSAVAWTYRWEPAESSHQPAAS
jgi:hypothetical protein